MTDPRSQRFCVIAGMSQSAPRLTRRWSDVLRNTAPFTLNDALQAAMLFAESEFLPNLWAITFDEILAVRIVVDHQLDDPLVCELATVQPDETQDRIVDLSETLARVIPDRQVNSRWQCSTSDCPLH